MKTSFSKFVLALMLLPLFSIALVAQDHAGDKKITITKRSVDKDGSEITETIIKKGKAAENFDAERYVRENKNADTDVDIRIESGDDNVTYYDSEADDERGENHDGGWNIHWNGDFPLRKGAIAWGRCGEDNDQRGFLGVEEDSDENPDEPGIVVQVVRNSAAEKAGLKTNDVVLQLNNSKTDRWDELSKLMATTKPGDKIKVTYFRNGKTQTAEATLSKHSEVSKANCDNQEKRGFLGVSEMGDDDSDAPGVKVSITKNSGAEKAGLKTGDVILKLNDAEIGDFEDISDVMSDTKSGDKIKVTYSRDGKQNTADATIGEQKTTWNFSDLDNLGDLKFDINTREKEACLGVFSQTSGEANAPGTKVNDFTEESAARDVSMQIGDVITAVNGQAVNSHQELWDEIAKFKPGEKVKVAYSRSGQAMTVEATLKACKDKSSIISIPENLRQFRTWNWENSDNERFRQRQIITIRKSDGDAAKVNVPPANTPAATDRNLKLENFRAFPNPTQGQANIEFRGEAVPTIVNLLDISGRQLFREELNGFDGNYTQQFDLSAYAKGTIVVQVLQGDKVFSEQIVVN